MSEELTDREKQAQLEEALMAFGKRMGIAKSKRKRLAMLNRALKLAAENDGGTIVFRFPDGREVGIDYNKAEMTAIVAALYSIAFKEAVNKGLDTMAEELKELVAKAKEAEPTEADAEAADAESGDGDEEAEDTDTTTTRPTQGKREPDE